MFPSCKESSGAAAPSLIAASRAASTTSSVLGAVAKRSQGGDSEILPKQIPGDKIDWTKKQQIKGKLNY